ncbi:MAG: hypothetical protein Ta2B_15620 [Termitinemataceae bacterium]|nr:MAG: hypothetical protein Ta2B_15620 [Termitinemataceae bacterium]
MRNELIQTELDEIKIAISVLSSKVSELSDSPATGEDENSAIDAPNNYYTNALLNDPYTDLLIDNKIQKLEIRLTNKIDNMRTSITSEISKVRDSIPEKPNYIVMFVSVGVATIIAIVAIFSGIIPTYTKNEWNDHKDELKNAVLDSINNDFKSNLFEENSKQIDKKLDLYKVDINKYINDKINEK